MSTGREPLCHAALNGDRDHPAVPRTPAEITAEAKAAVDAGAATVHLHPYGDDGRQTFAAEPCAAAIARWAVSRRGLGRGHSVRAGLEDTPVLPDGREATGNGELVAAAVALIAAAGHP